MDLAGFATTTIRKHQGNVRVGDTLWVRVFVREGCLQGGWGGVSGGCPDGKHGVPVGECGENQHGVPVVSVQRQFGADTE